MTPIDYIGNVVLGGITSGIIYNSEIPFHYFVLVLLIAIGMISPLNFITKRFLVVRRPSHQPLCQSSSMGFFR